MPTSVKVSGNQYQVTFSTDIKDYNREDGGYLTPIPVLRGKDILVPLEASLIVDVEIERPSNRLFIKSWTVKHNTNGLEDRWGDRLTNEIVVNATTRYLWERGLAIPVPDNFYAMGLVGIVIDDDINKISSKLKKNPFDSEVLESLREEGKYKISTKGDINKGFILTTYLWAINNIPLGFQLEYCERLLGLKANEMSNFISRYSFTFEEISKANLTGNLFNGKEKFDYEGKPVYFVKHSDEKVQGGYLPKWLSTQVEDYISEMVQMPYTLQPEMKGATV